MSKDHKMTTGMTVKGTSTGRLTKPNPEPHSFPVGNGRTVVDFSTPSNSIKAEDLKGFPFQEPGIRGKSGFRPDCVVVDDVIPEPGMTFLDEEPGPEDETKFYNALTMGERRKDLRNYGMKSLYHWSSESLKAYSEGDIIVMAETVEQARDKVYAQFNPLADGNPFEDHYLQMLKLNDDEDLQYEYTEKLNVLREDLDKEPTIVSTDVVLIRGSD